MKLGISDSRVSRASSDHPDISNKTQIKVKRTAKAFQYTPTSFQRKILRENNFKNHRRHKYLFEAEIHNDFSLPQSAG